MNAFTYFVIKYLLMKNIYINNEYKNNDINSLSLFNTKMDINIDKVIAENMIAIYNKRYKNNQKHIDILNTLIESMTIFVSNINE